MGIEDAISTLPTVIRISKGTGRTNGCRSITAPHREQTGIAPFGGLSTIAGPQQQDEQR